MVRTLLLALGLLTLLGTLAVAEDAPFKLEDPDDPVVVMKTNHGDVYLELFAKAAPKTVENFLGLAEGTKPFTDPATGKEAKRPYYDGLVFHRVIQGFMIQGGCPLGTGFGGPGYKFDDEINAKALGLDEIKAVQIGPNGIGLQDWVRISIPDQGTFSRYVLKPAWDALGIKTSEEAKKREQDIKDYLAKMTVMDVYENMGYVYDDSLPSRKPVKGALAMANSGPNTNGSQFFINLGDTPHLTGKHTVFGKVVKGMDVVEKIGAVPVDPRTRKPKEPVTIESIRRYEP